MKARPILMSGGMVRATLDGRKTQTRRVVKEQERLRQGRTHLGRPSVEYLNEWGSWQPWVPNAKTMRCPYGLPGDLLYVREAWGTGCRPCPREGWRDGIEYRADEAYLDEHDDLPLNSDVSPPVDFEWESLQSGWRPSIHMPRWASRLTLEITGIRVERVQEISGEDEEAEGVPDGVFFDCLWDTLNAKRGFGWAVNPWVWVVAFRPIARNVDAVIGSMAA